MVDRDKINTDYKSYNVFMDFLFHQWHMNISKRSFQPNRLDLKCFIKVPHEILS